MDGDESVTLPELTDLVCSMLAKDHDIDRAVRAALDRDPSPIQVIKALRAITGIGLAEAKPIVDRNLSRDVQEANELIRDAAWDAAQQIDDEPRSQESCSPRPSPTSSDIAAKMRFAGWIVSR